MINQFTNKLIEDLEELIKDDDRPYYKSNIQPLFEEAVISVLELYKPQGDRRDISAKIKQLRSKIIV